MQSVVERIAARCLLALESPLAFAAFITSFDDRPISLVPYATMLLKLEGTKKPTRAKMFYGVVESLFSVRAKLVFEDLRFDRGSVLQSGDGDEEAFDSVLLCRWLLHAISLFGVAGPQLERTWLRAFGRARSSSSHRRVARGDLEMMVFRRASSFSQSMLEGSATRMIVAGTRNHSLWTKTLLKGTPTGRMMMLYLLGTYLDRPTIFDGLFAAIEEQNEVSEISEDLAALVGALLTHVDCSHVKATQRFVDAMLSLWTKSICFRQEALGETIASLVGQLVASPSPYIRAKSIVSCEGWNGRIVGLCLREPQGDTPHLEARSRMLSSMMSISAEYTSSAIITRSASVSDMPRIITEGVMDRCVSEYFTLRHQNGTTEQVFHDFIVGAHLDWLLANGGVQERLGRVIEVSSIIARTGRIPSGNNCPGIERSLVKCLEGSSRISILPVCDVLLCLPTTKEYQISARTTTTCVRYIASTIRVLLRKHYAGNRESDTPCDDHVLALGFDCWRRALTSNSAVEEWPVPAVLDCVRTCLKFGINGSLEKDDDVPRMCFEALMVLLSVSGGFLVDRSIASTKTVHSLARENAAMKNKKSH